ncbi:hypothetical protein C5U62_29955 [Pseudomonas protegens]|uniref:Thioredoxin domain-containing protein n=1 Tax=Pseudomonas protegens TaxID=380021 RepID=A0A2T6GD28_9PSED|nr:DsbA family protein [Pseudomonas protegens]PUA42066.1 hypothetical protein C5U62_29955 [Pseudomonas protegens]
MKSLPLLKCLRCELWLAIAAALLTGGLIVALVLPPSSKTEHTGPWLYGPREARWSLIEYADLKCPYCKAYTPQLKTWVDQHPLVNLQWHHLPLSSHEPAATRLAILAECAGRLGGNAAFWTTVEGVFDHADAPPRKLPNIDPQALEQCLENNEQVTQTIQAQRDEALAQGIKATPTLRVKDNQSGRYVTLEGPVDNATLLSAIDWLSTSETEQK